MGFKDLYSALNSELPYIDMHFPDLNCGGCGAFALYLSKELDKIGVDHSIVWIGENYGDCDEDTHELLHSVFHDNGQWSNVTNFHDVDISLTHIMIDIDGYLVDSTGVYMSLDDTEFYMKSELGVITQEQLEWLVSNPEGWNSWFNRDDMPKVNKMVKKAMKKIAKNLEN